MLEYYVIDAGIILLNQSAVTTYQIQTQSPEKLFHIYKQKQ